MQHKRKPTDHEFRQQKPASIRFLKTDDGLEIRQRWWRADFNMLMIMGLIWGGVMLLVVGQVIMATGFEAMGIVFCSSLHLIIGVVWLYWVIATVMNTTTITFDPQMIEIFNGPVPFGNRYSVIATATVSEVKTRKQTYTVGNRNAHALVAVTHYGDEIKLLGGIFIEKEAGFLRDEIELFLATVEPEPIKRKLSG